MRFVLVLLLCTRAVASDMPRGAWASFRPGAWKSTLHEARDRHGKVVRAGTTRWRLLEVRRTESLVEQTYLQTRPKAIESREVLRIPHGRPLYLGTLVERRPEDLNVCGEVVPCQRIVAKTPDGDVVAWYSEKVPGFVVMEDSNEGHTEATDWQAR